MNLHDDAAVALQTEEMWPKERGRRAPSAASSTLGCWLWQQVFREQVMID